MFDLSLVSKTFNSYRDLIEILKQKNEISNHKIVVFVKEKEFRQIRDKKVKSVTKDYTHNAYRSLVEIENKIIDLYNATYLIISYPEIKTKIDKISYNEFIIYHLEYYLISQVALFDRILHLCNFVYGLGYKGLGINYKNIKKDEKTNSDCKSKLIKFNDYLSDIKNNEIRNTQNDIKHKKRLVVKEVDDISFSKFSAEIAMRLGDINLSREKVQEFDSSSESYLLDLVNKNISEIKELQTLTKNILDIVSIKIKEEFRMSAEIS